MALVLIVDDDDTIRDLVANMVRLCGHEVLTARNGLEAVAVFRSYAESIDLVITDLKMPVMNGYEAIARIRETRPQARIACMSGYSEREVPPDTAFLQKPFKLDELRTLITRLLRKQQSSP